MEWYKVDIRLHKSIDIRLKDVNNFEEAEGRVNQVIESLKAEIMEEVEDVITKESDAC